ncbi:MAG: helix-turn-helix domain-containing protein [Pseudomonadota bacterium]
MTHYWRFQSLKLPRALEELGVRTQVFAKAEPGQSIRVEPVSDSVTLVFGLGSRWTFSTVDGESLHTSAALFGPMCRPQRVINDDSGRCLEVSLPPWLASEIFSSELVSTRSPLSIAGELDAAVRGYVEAVTTSPDLEAAAKALVKFLGDRQAAKKRVTRTEVQWAWKRLTGRQPVTVESLAKEIGWSERHFANLYSDAIGCSPKRSSQLTRFLTAHQMLLENPVSMVEVSASSGYYDQSHMIRNFREFAGLTPKQVREQEAQHQVIAG